MNRSFFFEDQVYDWGRFQKTNSHTRTNYPQVTPPTTTGWLYRYYTANRLLNRHVVCDVPVSCKANGDRNQLWAWLDSDLKDD